MKKIIHGLEHSVVQGISAANLIEQLKPDKVLVERVNLKGFNSSGEVAAIYEICKKHDISIIPIDKPRTTIQTIKAVIFMFFDSFLYILFWFIFRISVLVGISTIEMFQRYTNMARCLPFSSFIDGEREKYFIERIEKEDNGNGLMFVVLGLAHVKTLRDYFEI